MTPDDAVDAALVGRVRAGDVDAYDELVRRHMQRAHAVAFRLLGNREDAEDLVQDAFIQALDKIDSFDIERPFAPWFFRILTNRGLNLRQSRALRSVSEIPDDTASHDESPELSAEREELRTRLREAVATLPERQQLIVQLFEIDGMDECRSRDRVRHLGWNGPLARARGTARVARGVGPLRRQEQN